MTAPAFDTTTMSAECALARKPGFTSLHRDCRQTQDIRPPYGAGILQARCTCPCHARITGT